MQTALPLKRVQVLEPKWYQQAVLDRSRLDAHLYCLSGATTTLHIVVIDLGSPVIMSFVLTLQDSVPVSTNRIEF